MKKIVIQFCILLFCVNIGFSQQKNVPVFISGTEGYKSFRIPAIIKTPNNDLLAFCEGLVYLHNVSNLL